GQLAPLLEPRERRRPPHRAPERPGEPPLLARHRPAAGQDRRALQRRFRLRYRLLDERMSVRLRLRDPFSLEGSLRQLRDVDYNILGRSEQSTRSAEISVSYALG